MIQQKILTLIENKQTQQGKPFWKVHFDNLAFNIFDLDMIKGIEQGDLCEINFHQNEKGYNQLDNVKKLTGEAPKANSKQDFHLTAEAIRIGALDAAIKVTKKTGTEDYAGDLFTTFKQFEHWIKTGENLDGSQE